MNLTQIELLIRELPFYLYCRVLFYKLTHFVSILNPLFEADGNITGIIPSRPVRVIVEVELGRAEEDYASWYNMTLNHGPINLVHNILLP